MSIFKRLYGRRIPQTKLPDAENPTGTGEEKQTTPTTAGEGTTTTAAAETTATAAATTTTTTETTTGGTTTATETTPTTAAITDTTAVTGGAETTATANETNTTSNGPTTNGAPRTFQFGAKAKILRDMLAQHRFKLINAATASTTGGSDQNTLMWIICMLALAIVCSFVSIGTNHWQCEGDQNYGLWNTCQKQTALALPVETVTGNTNSTTESTTTNSTTTFTLMCLHHNKFNQLELAVVDQSRVDQVQASQGLIVCGTIIYVASLVALSLAYRFVKQKATSNLNTMRNLLVGAIFAQMLALLLHIIGFFLYILTERISISVGLLFVYFGLGVFILPCINFVTIEYKAYKMRQQQLQIN